MAAVSVLGLSSATCLDVAGPEVDPAVELYGGGLRFAVFESPGQRPAYQPGTFESHGREPRITLALGTIAERWPCFGHLDVQVEIDGRTIRAVPGEVSPSTGPCTGFRGRGRFSQFLPISEGSYALHVDVAGRMHAYDLRIEAEAIEIVAAGDTTAAPAVAGFVDPVASRFWRFPSRSLAAYCVAGASGPPCAETFERLAHALDLTPHAFSSGGELPFAESYHVGDEVRFFRYASEDDTRGLRDLVCELVPDSTGNSGSGYLTVVTWTGDGASSWGSCK